MEEIFKTRDFYTAVVLKTLGFRLIRMEKGSGSFVTFVFKDSDGKAKEAINRYWERKVVCNARELIETINELKTRIHERSGNDR